MTNTRFFTYSFSILSTDNKIKILNAEAINFAKDIFNTIAEKKEEAKKTEGQ